MAHVGTGHGLGKTHAGIELDEIETIDINTELDFRFAEFLLKDNIIA